MPAHTSARLVSGPLQIERQEDGYRLLLRDLVVIVDGLEIAVPAGTLTDFSTIPWYGRVVVRWSKVDIAGVVHDSLYQTPVLSRARADRIWRILARTGNHRANALQAWICWAALRIGGWVTWNRLRREDISLQFGYREGTQSFPQQPRSGVDEWSRAA